MSLLQVSVSGGIMIVLITLIRALAINHLPKKTFLVMWGIVLFRLLLPFSFPSSLSIYSLLNPTDTTGHIILNPAANFLPIVTITPTGTSPIVPTSHGVALSLWLIVWCIGMILFGLYFTFAYLKCRYEFKSCQIVENEYVRNWLKNNALKRVITIRQTGRIAAPLTYGIFHPVILMPEKTDWSDTKKLQFVLAHEYAHIRRFDIATKILLTAALCIHWFNPFAWVMYILSNRDMELSCDEAVLHSFGETVKSAYALALINMEEQKSHMTPFCNSFSKTAIEERIKAIMKSKRTTKLNICISIVAILCVAIPFATNAQALEKPPSSLPTSQTNSAKATVRDGVTTIPIDIQSINSGEYYWLGEYTLSAGDTIRYDIPTITGEKIAVGFAGLTTVTPTHFTNINEKESDSLVVNGYFEVTAERAGRYRLFIKAEQGQLTNIKGVIKVGKFSPYDNDSLSQENRPESTGIKFTAEQPNVTTYVMDESNKIIVPVSVRSLGPDTAICVGEIPNIKDMSELKYDVHAANGAGTLYVAMRKTNADDGTWFNHVGMVGEGKTGKDIVWNMVSDNNKFFGYDGSYTGNYLIYILSKSGSLSDIGGSITITYGKQTSSETKTADTSIPLSVPIDVSSINSGEYVWLGEYSLTTGDKITYDVSAKSGSGLEIGFAALNDDPSNRTFYTVSNKTLTINANRTFSDQTTPGQYKLFIRPIGGEALTGILGTVTIGK